MLGKQIRGEHHTYTDGQSAEDAEPFGREAAYLDSLTDQYNLCGWVGLGALRGVTKLSRKRYEFAVIST